MHGSVRSELSRGPSDTAYWSTQHSIYRSGSGHYRCCAESRQTAGVPMCAGPKPVPYDCGQSDRGLARGLDSQQQSAQTIRQGQLVRPDVCIPARSNTAPNMRLQRCRGTTCIAIPDRVKLCMLGVLSAPASTSISGLPGSQTLRFSRGNG